MLVCPLVETELETTELGQEASSLDPTSTRDHSYGLSPTPNVTGIKLQTLTENLGGHNGNFTLTHSK